MATGRFVLAPGVPQFIHIKSGARVTKAVTGLANGTIGKATMFALFSPVARGIVTARHRGFLMRTKEGATIGFRFRISSHCSLLNVHVITSKNAFDSNRRRLLPMLDGGRCVARALTVPVHNRRAHAFSLSDLFGHGDHATASHHLAMRFAKGPT